ncbi:hypothetical protein OPV22_000563 [Ensete ventricosum]|uniref:Uncharacterized protein n=1 Tax=Ensete ventricosum TaxID=4639 RepID=A0AAV8RVM3_ENSVE|nr:hypothetical protein OPV22_000563 [Ensete ventricosum]
MGRLTSTSPTKRASAAFITDCCVGAGKGDFKQQILRAGFAFVPSLELVFQLTVEQLLRLMLMLQLVLAAVAAWCFIFGFVVGEKRSVEVAYWPGASTRSNREQSLLFTPRLWSNLHSHAAPETRANPGQPWVRGWDNKRGVDGGPIYGNQ